MKHRFKAAVLVPATLLILTVTGACYRVVLEPLGLRDVQEEDTEGPDEGDGTNDVVNQETGETPEDDGGGGDAIDDEGAGATLAVVVLEELSDGTMSPVDGATVAFDAPGGGRTEDITGPDGRATFAGLDFSLGTATATAHREGFYIKSIVTAGEEDGEIEMLLVRDRTGYVEISGSAANMSSHTNRLFVWASATPLAVWEDMGPDWSILVKPGAAFNLIAMEYDYDMVTATTRSTHIEIFGWTLTEHEAVAAPTTASIDFSTSADPTRVQGSFALPSRPGSVFRSSGKGFVNVRADHALLGRSYYTDISTDGESYDYEVEYVEMPGTTEVRTEYVAYQDIVDAAGLTYVVVSGMPNAGANDFGHLDMPGMISPNGTYLSDAQPLHDPIEWELFDSDVVVTVRIYGYTYDPADSNTLLTIPGDWEIVLPPDSTTAVIPEFPSTVDAAGFFGGQTAVFCRVWLLQEPDGGEVLQRWSSSIRFMLTR